MSGSKMLILRGNSAEAGTYPDEQGNNIAWPAGALHVWAASEYARRNGYEPVLLDIPGQPQSETSPQATEALKRFLDANQSVTAFYGFSGGGYNLWWILLSLAKNHRKLSIALIWLSCLVHRKSLSPSMSRPNITRL